MSTLSDWLDEQDYTLAQAVSFAAVEVAPAPQGQQTAADSVAEVDGTGVDAAREAEATASTAYQNGNQNPSDPTFLSAFSNAPANGATTLFAIALGRSGFFPGGGATGSQQYGQLLTGLGKCPLFTINAQDAVSLSKTGISPDDVPGLLLQKTPFDSPALQQAVSASVTQLVAAADKQRANQAQTLLLYLFELAIDENQTFNLFTVNAELTAVYKANKKGASGQNNDSGQNGGDGETDPSDGGGSTPTPGGTVTFTISANTSTMTLLFLQTLWPQWAAQVATKGFVKLDQWQQMMSTR